MSKLFYVKLSAKIVGNKIVGLDKRVLKGAQNDKVKLEIDKANYETEQEKFKDIGEAYLLPTVREFADKMKKLGIPINLNTNKICYDVEIYDPEYPYLASENAILF